MDRTTNPVQPKSSFRTDWKETVAQVTAGLLLGALGVIALNIATGPQGQKALSNAVTPACATEDDTNCFWAAEQQGNATGDSFYVDDEGQVYYLPVNMTDTPEYRATAECAKQLTAFGRDAMVLANDLAGQWAQSDMGETTFGEYVITDNLQPMQDRYDYLIREFCS